jgi:hypothetical protein
VTGANNGDADDPAITVYLDDAIDTLWALDLLADWLDHPSADAHDDLGDFCGHRTTIENLEDTIARQATNIRRAVAAIGQEGAAIS